MKVGFDGKRATQNITGLGNYSRYLIRLLTKFHPHNQFLIYAITIPPPELAISEVEYRYPGKQLIKSYWRSFGIIKNLLRDNIDLFHGLSNEIPYSLKTAGIPTVVTIHDLIFIRYPQYYSFIDRLIYKYKYRYAALHADKVIAISKQTKQDLMHYFGVNEDKIEVIYQDCDVIFHQQVTSLMKDEIKKKYQLPEKYLLNVGTIEERKNLMLIAKALLRIDNIHLVVVGRETKYTLTVKQFIKQNQLSERVHFLHNVAHCDLPAIYQHAELLIYPSRFEGFGIPIVEALHSGIPVIAAKGSCLEEAGGPGSIYIDPDDDVELAKQVKGIIDNNETKMKMVRMGKQYLDNFKSKLISDQTIHLYQNVIDNAKR
ncbi:glycosyltransferase family 4 protein [Daejeonella sp.]|uniref:glycosyltransferase family 4 protein n=1 Tax=Daejeonella sp. TaxID=2805397 RepID=UPI0039836BC6